MAKVTGEIPNLINGVSQQAPALRLPTQANEQINFYSTIVEGLRKRPPLRHVAKIMDSVPSGAFFHIIHRDQNEKYVVVITNGDLKVFDFQGNEKTVNFPNGKGYLSNVNPTTGFAALTVADYTFIANRSVTCQMDTSVKSPTRPYEALVNIQAGNYGKTYEIRVNGNPVASHATPDGSNAAQSPMIATTVIAGELYNDLVANLGNDGNPWGIGLHGNAIHIVNYQTDFSLWVADGVNGNAVRIVKGASQKFSDLPNFAPQSFVAEIANSEGTNLDNYWVMADKGGTDNNSKVVWREVTKPGTTLAIDAATMPHLLVRNPDGTFTFKQAVWDQRKAGDEEKISPDPSFIGNKIQDIVFHRNRLCFLADENIIMSRSGSFFDFFRTTATALLDDDPIDIASTHIKVSFLKHAIPHQDYLLLFSPQTQFRLAGNEQLTAKTVSLRPLTEFSSSETVPPIACGGGVFFVYDAPSVEYATVYEYTLDKSVETANADNITAHVPAYIPAGVTRLVGSPDLNVLALLSNGAKDTIFVYSYYWVNDEKVQSSWSKWTFEGCELVDAKFIEGDLYVVYARQSKLLLGKIRMEPAASDDDLDYQIYLDHRVHSDSLSAPSYNPTADQTTYTLPYNAGEDIRAVVVPGGTGVVGAGVRVEETSGTTVKLRGDTRTHKLLFGYPFTSRYRFSTFHVRSGTPGGGSVVRTDGRLQVIHLNLVYSKSAYFRLEVASDNRPTVEYPFNSWLIGSPRTIVGTAVLETGRFNIPVMSRNDRVTIDIVNDTWLPSNFLSATWRGVFNPKSRQM